MYNQRELRRQLQWQKTTEVRHGIQNPGRKAGEGLGGAKAASEPGIPENTMYAWTKAAKEGRLDAGPGPHTPQTAMSLAEQLSTLRRQVKEQEKEIRPLKEENEFLEEAGAFFAAGRRKSAKGWE